MEHRPIHGAGDESKPVRPAANSDRPAGTEGARAQGPAFQALLERLQERARELAEASQTADDPARLAGAVDRARASLEDALSLGDQLLEAWRASAHQRTEPGPEGGPR